ncbi:rhomboid family intramembrane serine protease, partial [Candidatus Marinimicrobia bacterium]|nr:rhomboid family intramembrane serine protease [Candidatus Neomarinimicrobiota bacterium]
FNPGEAAYKPQIFTEAIKILISINFVIYVLQSLAGKEDIFFRLFGLVPNVFISELMLWQPFTYMFFHAPYYSSIGISHILLNMLGLWVFGRELEQAWGKSKFLKYYFLTGIGSGLITYLFQINSDNPVIGASGAVYGILLAYGISFPNRMLYIWGLIPIRSIWLVVIMGSIAFFGLLGRADGISHVTHISGMFIGYILLKKKWQLADIIFAMRKKTVEFQVQRKEDRALKKKSINRDIDMILEKIKEVGFSGLSNEEQSKLYETSKSLSKSGQRD